MIAQRQFPPTYASSEAAGRHIRRLVQSVQRQTALDFPHSTALRPASVGLVGAGVMGASIAAALVRHRLPVVVTDQNPDALGTVRDRVAVWLRADHPDLPPAMLAELTQLVHPTASWEAFGGCDLVVEAVREDVLVKRQLLARLEPKLRVGAVLATNTSTIPLARLAPALGDPGQFCGCHFFLPLGQGPMIEIVRGSRSRPETIAAAVGLAQHLGYLPLVVADAPGFVVNRLLLLYLSEALQLVAEGVPVEAVEATAEAFGMLVGPLRLLDEIGLDTAVECGFAMSDGGLLLRSPLLVAMVKARRLGRKAGAGFFRYDTDARSPATPPQTPPARDHARPPDDSLRQILARCVSSSRPAPTPEIIRHRLLLPMLVEAAWMIERGAVRDAGQIDLAVLLGFGFAPAHGGLLTWADQLGTARVLELLAELGELGERFRPPPLLLDMNRQGRKFYLQEPQPERPAVSPGQHPLQTPASRAGRSPWRTSNS
jgi:3-hydroxyacyl-CoA dehydrogenase